MTQHKPRGINMPTTIRIPPDAYPCEECDCQQPNHDCHCWSCCGYANILRAKADARDGVAMARLDIGYDADAYRRDVREFATCRFCDWRSQVVEVGDVLTDVEVESRALTEFDSHLADRRDCAALAFAYTAAQEGGCKHAN